MACVMPWHYHGFLQQNLMHPDPGLRLRIAYALAIQSWSRRHEPADAAAQNRVAELSRKLVPILTAALTSNKATWRRDAADGLGFLAPEAHELVLPALKAALNDEDHDVRTKATMGLHQYEAFGRK